MPPLGVHVLGRLVSHPSLRDTLTWPQVQRFLDFSQRILPEIKGSSNSEKLPLQLPSHVCGFLSVVLELEQSLVQLCWTAFGDMLVVPEDDTALSCDDIFRVHGHEFQIGLYHCLELYRSRTDLQH
jgi:hypothetical protein